MMRKRAVIVRSCNFLEKFSLRVEGSSYAHAKQNNC